MTPDLDLLTPLSQFRAVCENATVALFVMDGRQHCIYMNASAEEMTGFRLEQVQGRPLHDFVHHSHPDGRPYPLEDCPIDRAAPQNMQEKGEEIFVHPDGHFYPVAFTASPIRAEGRVIGTVIEVRDVTREKQRQREDAGMVQLADRMLHELDMGRLAQAVADTATQLSGARCGAFFYNSVDATGGVQRCQALAGDGAEAFAALPHASATRMFESAPRRARTLRVDDIREDARFAQGFARSLSDGGLKELRSYLAVPVRSDTGEVLGALFLGASRLGGFNEDHQRFVETVAAQAAVGMSRLRAFQAAAAEAAEKERLYLEAVRAGQMKDQFLATISHELRTPLTSILGWAEMLASGRLPPDGMEGAVGTIARNARAQAQIIDDLLDISRIVSGKLHLDVRSVDAAQPTEAAVEAVRPAAIARGVELVSSVADGLGEVRVDPDRLQQIVWNLVANAVKFTGRDGRVDVRLSRDGDELQVQVRDTGSGIEQAFLPYLFERFSQGDASSTREHGGLGLGLSIVRHLVEMHGGTVEAHSDGPGQGACFTVRLPVAPREETLPEPPRRGDRAIGSETHFPAHASMQGQRVLLVEDDTDTRNLLLTVLESTGAKVCASSSGIEALALLDAFDPTLVISDIGMPGMDGYEFIASVREQEARHGRDPVPAMALTAFARSEDRETALASGFDLHLAKPVHPAELLRLANSLRSRDRDLA
ncbi:hybrid sensor histidine kinase/response regulator [Luteimonas vadosa]|uniref:histidine kinase n=1 Tax=Luteimonas vadosa TaxID=1165507 RepID=A0ABP9E9C5_9GAMM